MIPDRERLPDTRLYVGERVARGGFASRASADE
jgi:hypothetical protein